MSQLSRKERELQARKEDILLAAAEVFSQKGFAEATMEEIAEKADFGKGTIYNYFSSKQDLFHTLVEQGCNEMTGIFTTVAQQDISPLEKVKLMFIREIQYIQEHVALFKMVSAELLCLDLQRLHREFEEKDEITVKIFAAGIKDGIFKKCDPLKLSVLYAGLLHSTIFHYWTHVKKLAPLTENELEELLDIFLTGIVNKEENYEEK